MKTNWQDPLSGEIISPDIAGLQEAVGKIEDALDLKVVNARNVPLTEIYISENDRYRIYQAAGKRNWVSNPAPVIKVNGTPVSSGFTINYGGGAVVFEPSLTVADVVTANFSYVTNVSNRLDAYVAGGENANGRYVKFNDGTQICWKTSLTISYKDNQAYIEGTWYYPASFISPPMALTPLITDWGSITNYYDKISAFYAASFATTTSYVRYILYKTSDAPGFSFGHNCKVAVMAIGRWK